MRKAKKMTIGTLLALSLFTIPTWTAHADEGVALKDFTVSSQDNAVKEILANDILHLRSETKSAYQIMLGEQLYQVDKKYILKTIRHKEESLSVLHDDYTLKTSPSLFGGTLLTLDEGDIVQRISEEKSQNGFVKVRTNQQVEGWVVDSILKPNIQNIPVETKAFIADDSAKSQSLFYGDAVTVTGFENSQFKLSVGDEEKWVGKEAISFTKPPKRLKYANPLKGYGASARVTSLPGYRIDPVYGGHDYHGGVDVAIPANTPIYATANGVVTQTHTGETYNNGAGYGNFVKMSHGDNESSVYAHLNSLVVKAGQYVKQGELVGYSGSTGKSTGNHLHFEIKKNGFLLGSSVVIRENGVVGELKPAPR